MAFISFYSPFSVVITWYEYNIASFLIITIKTSAVCPLCIQIWQDQAYRSHYVYNCHITVVYANLLTKWAWQTEEFDNEMGRMHPAHFIDKFLCLQLHILRMINEGETRSYKSLPSPCPWRIDPGGSADRDICMKSRLNNSHPRICATAAGCERQT